MANKNVNDVIAALNMLSSCYGDTETVAYECLPDALDDEDTEDLRNRLGENEAKFIKALAIVKQAIGLD